MEPEPEQQFVADASTQGLGVDGAFTSNMLHHMVLQATGGGAEPSVLRGESKPFVMPRVACTRLTNPRTPRRDVQLPGRGGSVRRLPVLGRLGPLARHPLRDGRRRRRERASPRVSCFSPGARRSLSRSVSDGSVVAARSGRSPSPRLTVSSWSRRGRARSCCRCRRMATKSPRTAAGSATVRAFGGA